MAARANPSRALRGAHTGAEPAAAFTPGQHLHAIWAAHFRGGGWVDEAPGWDAFDEAGHAQWDANAKALASTIGLSLAASDLLEALIAVHEPYKTLTEDALLAGILMEFGPPKPDRGAAQLKVRAAIFKALGAPPASPESVPTGELLGPSVPRNMPTRVVRAYQTRDGWKEII